MSCSKYLFISVAYLLALASVGAAGERCERSLIVSDISQRSQDFIGYLGRLLETRVIKEPELEKVLAELDGAGKLVNPISEEAAQLDYDRYIHRDGLEKLIIADGIDRELLKRWLLLTLEERGMARVEREEVRGETEDLYQKMIFHEIRSGSFVRSTTRWVQRTPVRKFFDWILRKPEAIIEQDETVTLESRVEITESFWMMSTPVTQKMWATVMKNNPAHFIYGPSTITMQIDGKTITMQPDNPVENVSMTGNKNYLQYSVSAFRFIRKLNKMSRDDDPLIYKIIPDHKMGDIYRLPTEAEWEFVARERGKTEEGSYLGEDEQQRREYAWVWENSEAMTHPVGEKKPLIIDGKKIYDLHGNVSEWLSDWHGDLMGSRRVVRGGSWNDLDRYVRFASRFSHDPNANSGTVGFRLVRIRRAK